MNNTRRFNTSAKRQHPRRRDAAAAQARVESMADAKLRLAIECGERRTYVEFDLARLLVSVSPY